MQSCVGVPLKDQHLHTSNSQYTCRGERRHSFKKQKVGDVLERLDAPNKNRKPTAAVCCDGWTKPADEWNIYRIKGGDDQQWTRESSEGVDIIHRLLLSSLSCRRDDWRHSLADCTAPATNNFTQKPIDWSCTHYYSSTDCVMVVNLIVINVECAR
jgi:hypothetical protein